MIGYVVPFSIYQKGYHYDTNLPLPFLNLAAQKNFIALYHRGIYMNPDLLKWFTDEYPNHCKLKLDIGKGCIRFKILNQIQYVLIGFRTMISLCQKKYIVIPKQKIPNFKLT